MKERPILFSTPMVHAIFDGAKSQTRRIVNPQPAQCDHSEFERYTGGPVPTTFFCIGDADWACATCGEGVRPDRSPERVRGIRCPYGEIGDRLWVRERGWISDSLQAFVPFAGNEDLTGPPLAPDSTPYKSRPAIHMPRWASRITLAIVGVRIERLHEITPLDVFAEGVRIPVDPETGEALLDLSSKHSPAKFLTKGCTGEEFVRAHYAALWESINGAGSWEENPWVWVVEFRRYTDG